MSASPTKLRLSLALSFLAFVMLGSVLLLAWLQYREELESRRLFSAFAKSQADFVREMHLPRSPKLASDLQRLSGVSIFFRQGDRINGARVHILSDAPADGQLLTLLKGREAIILRLDDKEDIIFERRHPGSSLSLDDPATRNVFLAFWAVSGFVGWLLARERLKRAQSERLAMLGRVATSLAHDIKNPLASIQLHAQLMTPQNEEDRHAIRLIENESAVIAGLVNQWLHLANPLPPKLVKLDLAACIQDVARNLDAQARHASVELLLTLPAPIFIMGDSQRMAQAVRNIMVNAIQAMPRGGKLSVNAHTLAHSCELRFTDSGTGFSESALAHGTELFFTEKEGGMGVGLNIVSSIVTAHGGTMHLQNDPKGGAVVIVSLPLLTA
ncbi:sensor histidine kinase [Prosthecobacter sp.]|uniref:sensor histidine kinase n=1 Tax=Prosthecobacter sp. TaxID=1965333 RepID=UPI003782E2B2